MKNSKVSSGGRPQSAGSRQLEQSTGAGTDDLAALEASGVLGELREATLSLLERRPDDPMLFLCSYFNDRMACNSAISRAFRHTCTRCSSDTRFMDSVAAAYLVGRPRGSGESADDDDGRSRMAADLRALPEGAPTKQRRLCELQ
uniref:RIIa domain-containing protein n=1 Tax=Tetraselmis sp. GSL018 TaxID=582737 RepID=A0A061RDN9_9CHLO